MITHIREWSNVEFANNYTEQAELQRMAKDIIENADHIENKPTPGYSQQNISRVITATSDILTNTKYIIHADGFRITNITEMVEA